MVEPALSKRLAQVAQFIPIGCRLADIGTDHAYLPVHLALAGKISSAIATDINEGPVQAARANVEKYQLQSVIDVRQGDGLAVLQPGEVDVIVLAGMGGSLVCRLLEEGKDKLVSVSRLIIQANTCTYQVRRWLMRNGWELKAEKMVEERGKYYEILMAEPGQGEAPYIGLDGEEREQALYMGPFLLQEKDEVFISKWTEEYEQKRRIIASLARAVSPESREKKEKFIRELSWIEGAIKK